MSENNETQVQETALGALSQVESTYGLKISVDEREQIAKFCACLYDHNQKVNLVSNAEPEYVVKRHVLDSLSLIEVIEARPSVKEGARPKLIDIGSGAGLPGLILAIALKGMNVVLLDSTKKKVDFLQATIASLALQDRVTALAARAEDLVREPGNREKFDLVTCRAVGHLRIVAELSLPFLRVGGAVLCQKTSKQATSELEQAFDHIKQLGGVCDVHVPAIQTGETEHCVIKIEKKSRTKPLYPRSFTVMKKECEAASMP